MMTLTMPESKLAEMSKIYDNYRLRIECAQMRGMCMWMKMRMR